MSTPQKILIIDDDKDMTEALKIILEDESYKVKVAFTGKQGLDAIREEKPDLIILDLLLPGEDGVSICRNLKNTPEYKDIPVLVLTALARKMEKKIFSPAVRENLGADEYLDNKPI
ncbi:MAG TPA: response regulator transcription factor [Candidatus Aerophobetes bacterium]|uniref:Response regulator transcription factor n=1 Tax=Aerophobetes bacterium TaxID=2030807 RepID=A0A7V5I048_UNCAE|nr:response regulator transcription factor [Candidatus Aerophobetes bacterium]